MYNRIWILYHTVNTIIFTLSRLVTVYRLIEWGSQSDRGRGDQANFVPFPPFKIFKFFRLTFPRSVIKSKSVELYSIIIHTQGAINMYCNILRGNDGFLYIVFASEEEAEQAQIQYNIPYICYSCFNGFMNALRIA